MPSYTDKVLEELAAGAVVVTATPRLSRYFLEQYDRLRQQGGAGAWPTPAARSWEQWIESEWRQLAAADPDLGRMMLLDDEQELLLWEKVIDRAGERNPEHALMQIAATARAARDTRRTLYGWCIPPGQIDAVVNADSAEFLRWLSDFDQTANRGSWLCRAELPGLLEKQLDNNAWRPHGPLVFAGFDQWTPSLERLLSSMQASGVELRIAPAPRINRCERAVYCKDRRREFEAAAHWARDLLIAGCDGPIGIVVDDLAAERDRVELAFDQILHQGESITQDEDRARAFHISIGKPLAEYPAISTALVLIDFMTGPRPVGDATQLLLSPFVSGGLSHYADHARLDLELRRRATQEVTPSILSSCAESLQMQSLSLPTGLAQAAKFSLPDAQAPSDWAALFIDWLEMLGWPGERALNSVEYQTIEAWRELLSRFARLNLVASRMSVSSAVAAIHRMAGRRIFQGRAAPAPVQILGVAESSGMQFSNLWISGMTDDAWPPPANPNPFIPFALQRRIGLPGAGVEGDLDRYAHITARLIGSAADVVISYSRSSTDQPGRLSGLFGDIDVAPGGPDHPGLAARIRESSPSLECIADTHGPALDSDDLRGGAGVLKDQSACPFRAFARHRLGVLDTPRLESGLDASARGSLLHESIAWVWTEIGSSRRLVEMDPGTVTEVVDRGVDRAVARFRLRNDSPFLGRILDLESARLSSLLLEWLNVERGRPAFTVVGVESELHTRFNGLAMTLRIDRLDELDDGSLAIIDYKTGSRVKIGQWDGDRPEEPQLPLYLLSVENDPRGVGGLAFAHLRTDASRFLGVARSTPFADGIVVQENWEEARDHWSGVLNALTDQFRNGAAAVDPRDRKVCEFCEVGPFCRVFDDGALSPEATDHD